MEKFYRLPTENDIILKLLYENDCIQLKTINFGVRGINHRSYNILNVSSFDVLEVTYIKCLMDETSTTERSLNFSVLTVMGFTFPSEFITNDIDIHEFLKIFESLDEIPIEIKVNNSGYREYTLPKSEFNIKDLGMLSTKTMFVSEFYFDTSNSVYKEYSIPKYNLMPNNNWMTVESPQQSLSYSYHDNIINTMRPLTQNFYDSNSKLKLFNIKDVVDKLYDLMNEYEDEIGIFTRFQKFHLAALLIRDTNFGNIFSVRDFQDPKENTALLRFDIPKEYFEYVKSDIISNEFKKLVLHISRNAIYGWNTISSSEGVILKYYLDPKSKIKHPRTMVKAYHPDTLVEHQLPFLEIENDDKFWYNIYVEDKQDWVRVPTNLYRLLKYFYTFNGNIVYHSVVEDKYNYYVNE